MTLLRFSLYLPLFLPDPTSVGTLFSRTLLRGGAADGVGLVALPYHQIDAAFAARGRAGIIEVLVSALAGAGAQS